MMSYEYDVFLSYRRWEKWPEWIKKWFLPTFRHWLGEELAGDLLKDNKEPSIAFDKEIESGRAWPTEIALRLSRSKVMVCLWSKTYFTSDWCRAEMTHILEREKECKFNTIKKPGRLVVGVTIHDGDDFPTEAQEMISIKLTNCANLYIAKDSPKAEELSDLIALLVRDVANAIRRAPKHESAWDNMAADTVIQLFEEGQQTRQEKLPSLGVI